MLRLIKLKVLHGLEYKEDEVKSSIAKFLTEEEMKAILNKMDAKAGDLILYCCR